MIDLRELQRGQPGLSPAAGAFYAEASAVCFESQGHQSGKLLALNGALGDLQEEVQWEPVNAQARRTWNDLQEATEYGAAGVAALLLLQRSQHAVLKRARKGTGFDYWLGPADQHPFQQKVKLEVSGILKGTASNVRDRVRKKTEQTKLSARAFPAYVAVVEFSAPQSTVALV